MIWIRGQSAWKFVTSATGGLGLEFVAASGGAIYLEDPAGQAQTLHYGGLGVGLSDSFKLPKIGKIKFAVKGRGVAVGVAPAVFPNRGWLFITDAFKGKELSRSDLRGATVFVEVGAGLIVGAGGTAMLLGISPTALLSAQAVPALLPFVLESAPAVLVAGGLTAGLQAGYGGAVFGGYVF